MGIRGTHSYPGRGSGGISTSGPENFSTVIERPHYFGNKEGGKYSAKNNGIKIRTRSAKGKKTRSTPKI
jgi:hypothetical protein